MTKPLTKEDIVSFFAGEQCDLNDLEFVLADELGQVAVVKYRTRLISGWGRRYNMMSAIFGNGGRQPSYMGDCISIVHRSNGDLGRESVFASSWTKLAIQSARTYERTVDWFGEMLLQRHVEVIFSKDREVARETIRISSRKLAPAAIAAS